MHIRIDPSFFLTKRTGAPQGDELGRIKPLSKSSCIGLTIPSFLKGLNGTEHGQSEQNQGLTRSQTRLLFWEEVQEDLRERLQGSHKQQVHLRGVSPRLWCL